MALWMKRSVPGGGLVLSSRLARQNSAQWGRIRRHCALVRTSC